MEVSSQRFVLIYSLAMTHHRRAAEFYPETLMVLEVGVIKAKPST